MLDLDPAQVWADFLHGFAGLRLQRLLLINPPQVPQRWFDPAIARLGRYFVYPPTGLLYIAAAAQEALPKLSVRILDLNYELLHQANLPDFADYEAWKPLLEAELGNQEGLVVGLSYMFSPTKDVIEELAAFVRTQVPGAPLIIGGGQATFDYDSLLTGGLCDLVVRGEGELQIATIIGSLEAADSAGVPWGAACRLPGGLPYAFDSAPRGVPSGNIEIAPLYSLLPLGRYHEVGSLGAFSRYVGREKPFAPVLSNRGCRARCTFCSVRSFNGFGVRQRDTQGVVDEIKHLWEHHHIRVIDWLDDDLLFDEGRALELFEKLGEQVPGLEWICNNGLIAFAATERVLQAMVNSGLRAFTIGIESGNSAMLTRIKKPATKPKLREAKRRFDRYPEVLATGNYIIGFPNESFQEMLDTFEFALELQLDWAKFFICQPLKGTDMFSAFQSLGDDRVDYRRSEDFNPGKTQIGSEFLNSAGPGEPGELMVGQDIFKLPPDSIPSQDQIKEIWFTFNLVANVLRNRNLSPSGNPTKLIRWVESVYEAYPYDASLCAVLAYGNRLVGHSLQGEEYDRSFLRIVQDSSYWSRRVEQFPELWRLVRRTPDGRR